MPQSRKQVEEAAIAWLIRLRDGGAEDWERFTAWLEADPEHAAVYDEVALADDALGALPPAAPLPAANDEAPPQRSFGRRTFLGWSVAAALVATTGYLTLHQQADLYAIETGPGQRRSIDLADGSRIDLNGSTRIVLDRENVRFASLAEGEALFTMAHDPSRPFRVEAGDAEIRVVGTVFNVVHAGGEVEVAVAEGAVLFNPGREAVSLSAGMALRSAGGRLARVREDAAAVGGWRESRLSYSSATTARIAADLSRNLGVPVRAGPEVAGRRFSGVIVLDEDRERLFRRVAALLGVDARRSGEGWLLTAGSGAGP